MSEIKEIAYSTQRLDHLGIVAGICQQIGLIEQIDKYVGATERKVSVGEAVQAMVLNALGFVGRALYLTPEFFSNKPVDILIREGLTAEDFNDDSLGRALDTLYESGVTEVFAFIASHSLDVFGIKSSSIWIIPVSAWRVNMPNHRKTRRQFVSVMVIPETIVQT